MANGKIKPVEALKCGDLLMGPDSSTRRIISTCRGIGELYRVTPVKGDSYVVNEDHILCLKKTREDRDEFDSDNIVEISVRDYLTTSKWFKHIHKGWRIGVEFDSISEPLRIDPYFLGLWLGDGLSSGPAICTVDSEVVDYLGKYAKSLSLILRQDANRPAPVYHLTEADRARGPGRNRLCTALRAHNLIGNKHIPGRFKFAAWHERLRLLAGILDSDGHLSRGGYELTLKSERLFDDVLFLARSLGFACYKAKVKKTCVNNGKVGDYFRCHINGPIDRIPCKIQRKTAVPRRQKKNPLVHGITVEHIGQGAYYGFELAGPDGRFLLGDFTVTHNTVLFSYIAMAAAQRGSTAWILVHRRELVSQTSAALTAFGVPHGIVQAPHKLQMDARMQVASVQTLVNRMDKLPAPDLIISDECHHATSPTWRQIFDRAPSAKILGVTATPQRLDGRGLKEIFQDMVVGPSVRELTEAGFLARATVYAPPKMVDLGGIGVRAGDYEQEELARRMDQKRVTGDAVAHYTRICPGAAAIAFCVSVDHAKHVAEQFSEAGYRSVSVDGSLGRDDRAVRIGGLADGSVQVLTSCELISEGLDIPLTTAAILLRPTKSLGLCRQQIGRVLRPAPGKERAIILDHVGNIYEHGLPTDEIEWTLEGRAKRDKSKSLNLVVCPECFCTHVRADVCPECGFVYPTEKNGRQIGHADGELVEVTVKPAQKVWEFDSVTKKRMIGRAKTYQELKNLAVLFGYKPAWAHFAWKARQHRRVDA